MTYVICIAVRNIVEKLLLRREINQKKKGKSCLIYLQEKSDSRMN